MEAPSPAKKEEIGAKKTAKKAETKQAVPDKLPAPINVTVSGELQLKGADQQQKAHGAFYENYEFWLVVVTAALVYVTARLVSFTKKLWQSTQTTSERQAGEMQQSLAITRQAADAARESADAAKNEFVASHRPEIRIKHVLLTSEIWKDKPIEIKLIIVNSGLTTAHITECNIATLIHPNGSPLPPRPDFQRQPFIPAPTPNLESGTTMVLPRLTDNRPLTDADNAGIRQLTHRLYCHGYVHYRDNAGRLRTTSFCRYLHVPSHPATHQDLGKFVVHPDPDYEYQD